MVVTGEGEWGDKLIPGHSFLVLKVAVGFLSLEKAEVRQTEGQAAGGPPKPHFLGKSPHAFSLLKLLQFLPEVLVTIDMNT